MLGYCISGFAKKCSHLVLGQPNGFFLQANIYLDVAVWVLVYENVAGHNSFFIKFIIIPFYGIVFDVFRNTLIGLFVADDVIVVISLPQFYGRIKYTQ